MIVAVFPGQGSQTPGFLSSWLELDGARKILDGYSEAAQFDLIAAGTEWDADAIRDTKVAQPLIVAASLLSWHMFIQRGGAAPQGVAGHSVGEIAALVAAHVITADDGMRLVGIRGRAMAEAAAVERTGMSAVIGGDSDTVAAGLAALGLTAANYNGSGQLVAAGPLAALADLAATPPPGTRVIGLQVAGAFHTAAMAPAVDTLRSGAAAVEASDPDVSLWTNHDGSVVSSGREALELLVAQVASPVRWDLCMASFAAHDLTGLIEFCPGGTLTGLAKRALRGVPAVAIKTPDDLAAAVALGNGDPA